MPTQNELQLVVGMKFNIVIHGEPYTVLLRGWSEHEYLITSVPIMQTQPVRVAPQTGCTVSYVKEGVVTSFITTVEFMYVHAITFMLLHFPSSMIKKSNLRKYERLKVRVPLSYVQMVSGKKNEETAMTGDLNIEGALIFHAKPVEKDTMMKINLTLPNGVINNIEAVVRNIRHNPMNLKEPYATGIKFVDLSKEHQNTLENFMVSILNDK